MKNSLLILLILVFVSCKHNNLNYEKISFERAYKFDYEILINLLNDTTDRKHQTSATQFALKGDYKNALIHWDSVFQIKPKQLTKKQKDSIKNDFNLYSAYDFIINESKNHQIIILNEAHHSSLHRNFATSILEDLYKNGYKNLFIEGLTNGTNKDSLLNIRKHPVLSSGYYTKDPQFGNFIRTALEIGFELFAYETTKGFGGASREVEQAKNIKKVISQKPNEKFLIFCGFDHVYEGTHEFWGKTMAQNLKEFTGIDPLTIDQVQYSERGNNLYTPSFLKFLNIKEPSVLINNQNMPYGIRKENRFTDIAILHPKTNFIQERPEWLFNKPYQKVEVNFHGMDLDYPLMVLAFNKNEDINKAVPIDIVEIKNNDHSSYLALKSGDYTIVVISSENDARKFDLIVK